MTTPWLTQPTVRKPVANKRTSGYAQLDSPLNGSWDTWVTALAKPGALIFARVYESAYDHWQNAEDPDEYKSHGRYDGSLSMVSNGLPFPLTRQVVDTSNNPGRRILRNGYVEAVGATMWLSPLFFKRTGASRKAIEASDALVRTVLPNDILRLKAQDASFDSAGGTQGLRQERLRGLLFPASSLKQN